MPRSYAPRLWWGGGLARMQPWVSDVVGSAIGWRKERLRLAQVQDLDEAKALRHRDEDFLWACVSGGGEGLDIKSTCEEEHPRLSYGSDGSCASPLRGNQPSSPQAGTCTCTCIQAVRALVMPRVSGEL